MLPTGTGAISKSIHIVMTSVAVRTRVLCKTHRHAREVEVVVVIQLQEMVGSVFRLVRMRGKVDFNRFPAMGLLVSARQIHDDCRQKSLRTMWIPGNDRVGNIKSKECRSFIQRHNIVIIVRMSSVHAFGNFDVQTC